MPVEAFGHFDDQCSDGLLVFPVVHLNPPSARIPPLPPLADGKHSSAQVHAIECLIWVQKTKYSQGADDFRFGPESGLKTDIAGGPVRANLGSQGV